MHVQTPRLSALAALVAMGFSLVQCSTEVDPPPNYAWQAVYSELPSALLSVWGTSNRDVFTVGSDARDGTGPLALHFDGRAWTRINTHLSAGDLWWVFGPASDTVFMVGSGGTVLRHNPLTQSTERMTTPGTETLFGVWGTSATNVWAVGGNPSGATGAAQGVLWHFDGRAWSNVALPGDTSQRVTLFKVWGSRANDVWACGDNGTTLHFDGTAWSIVPIPEGARGRLFTVSGLGSQRYAVGGFASGVILEGDGAGWRQAPLTEAPRLNGVFVPQSGSPLAVGANGTVLQRRGGTWRTTARAPRTDYDFHSVWVDPTGQVWAVGGQIASTPLNHGMLMHFGTNVPAGPIVTDPEILRCPETSGSICTWAGTSEAGFNGDGRDRRESNLYWPVDMEFDSNDRGYVLDWNNHRIRRVLEDQRFETIMGTPIPGDGPEDLSDLMSPGAMGDTVSLNHPTDLVFRPDGTLSVVAWHNHKIRSWNPQSGRVTVSIGRGGGFTGDNGPAAMALLKQPSRAALDATGNLYILDQGNLRIRRVSSEGVITTVAGDGMRRFGGDGGAPLMASFTFQVGENPEPEGALALDAMGRLYVADTGNHRIRLIDFTANTITTVVGTGTAGYSGDDGPALMAAINSPRDIEVGPNGNLWIADTGNHRVRVVDLATGVIRTVAGVGTHGFSGDRGPAVRAELWRPFGIAFDRAGNVYIADSYNNRIRRIAR